MTVAVGVVEAPVEVPVLEEGPPTTELERHIVDCREGAPRDETLCGRLWDRLNVSRGPLCEACEAEYRKRHPGWPLPG